ncbi:SDR family oxidoreductase [Streptomyces sp. MP131-18]|uniref:SDR family oxidoreductase n=1 Tax=Streptomyces sp. MP131-18 TaxID=1857892 RepID=UPI00097BBB94|nr:SDR family oxidoreductase [Streptomyces sp. MP131-18]ONK12665.1 Cholesterol dehydrogenase [Streptomyces sp. MP131-18]
MSLRCLVTGATGYLGGRLVPELLAAGHTVRCLARTPGKLAGRPWAPRAEVVRGDVTDAASVRAALENIDVAYYLVHSLGKGRHFEETDRRAARVFAEQARDAGVRRLVYAGALTPAGVPEGDLSPHLRSRAEVGRIFLASGVPAAVLRAAVVIGSGSASFEMLRQLSERLPVMVTPRWVRTRVQPVAVRDMLAVLAGSARLPADVNRTFDIGGPDVVTYHTMMRRYAVHARLRRRLIVPVPVLSPWLSSLWVGLVTPLPGPLARPLVESLRHEVVCRERDIEAYVPMPPGGFLGLDDALKAALRRVGESEQEGPGAAAGPLPTDPPWAGGSIYTDRRERTVGATPEALWRVVEGIGGENGWYSSPVAWAVRGWLDSLVGGGGLRRGRRDAARLRPGDGLDFWRVEALEPERLLRLRGEMRVPGTAWLELRVDRDDHGRTVYRQRALFRPRGLAGHVYWWAVSPFHAWVFGGMVRNIASTAQAEG